MYGIEDTGRDRNRPTDRIITVWNLTTPPSSWPPPPPGLIAGEPVSDPCADIETMLLAIPGDHTRLSAGLQHRIGLILHDLLDHGFRAVSCRRAVDGSAVYRLVNGPDHRGAPPRPGSN
jgi:hypothetical protein